MGCFALLILILLQLLLFVYGQDIITTIAGTGTASYSGDGGSATAAALNKPFGVCLDSSGNMYIADTSNQYIRKWTVSTGIISTIAGSSTSGGYTGDEGAATSALLKEPRGVSLDSSGNVYIADRNNYVIRKVTVSTGIITTIAGKGTASYSGDDGPATSAALNNPYDVGVDSSGNVYIGDQDNHRIRKVTVSTGIITTILGIGTGSYSGDDGPADEAAVNSPHGVGLDSSDNVYIADTNNQRIRKVTVSTGIVTTIAGSGGTGSYSGDDGPATSATLYNPYGVCSDSSGNVYIGDRDNNRIRKVTVSTGIITTISGTGTSSYSGDDGPATSATLSFPRGVGVDLSGNVYIADSDNSRIRKVTVLTIVPSVTPSASPTTLPTMIPSLSPTHIPSEVPSAVPSMIPSCSPSTTPSTLPTTLPSSSSTPSTIASTSPTYLPTLSPSAYPTYTSSVHVYFMVTQVLSGISATTYASNKESNDAVFKQTVVSVLGYDSKLQDVGIQPVTDLSVSFTRSQSSTAVETELMYSITTPTRIFNDTNHAITAFIRALNESITTKAFDTLLHANAVAADITDLQSVISTISVIFSTASPTSSPTAGPTSSPTKLDIIAANILDIPLDGEVAKVKVKYYLGTFVGYFLCIYICLYLYGLLRYGKETAMKLYDSSYQSGGYITHSAITDTSDNSVSILSDLYTKNALVQSSVKADEDLKLVKEAVPQKETEYKDEVVVDKFSKGYHEYVDQRRTLLGCSPFLCPDGYVVQIPCTSREINFPPGRVEDVLLYICHNHPLFSCFYYMDGSKLGVHGTRIIYISKVVVVFVLYQFSNMLLQHLMLDGRGLGTLINLFIITPSAVSIGLLLKYLYTCPFTETVDFQRRYAKYQSTVLFLGRLAIIPIVLIMCISLFFACLFSSSRRIPPILVNFFLSVQLYGLLLEVVKTMLLFVDNYYFQVSLFGLFDILCIGKVYKERILIEQLVVYVNYAYRIDTYLLGLIKVQKILNRDDAIKAKWIAVEGDTGDDIEMEGPGERDDAFDVQNPLTKVLSQRNSESFPFGTIHNNNDEEEDGYNNIISNNSSPVKISASYVTDSYLAIDKKNQELSRFHQSDASILDDDATLYLEYQSQQNMQQDDAAYDMTNDGEAAMTFEEWKIRRKQFKQGTRGSFVKAFQAFEEREQLSVLGGTFNQSPSVINTMYLHKATVKNVLASKSNRKV